MKLKGGRSHHRKCFVQELCPCHIERMNASHACTVRWSAGRRSSHAKEETECKT